MDARSEADGSESQAARQSLPPSMVGWIGGWLAIAALAFWLARLSAPWLLVAAAGTCLWGWGARKRPDAWYLSVLAALWLATGVGFGVQYRLGAIASEWPRVQMRIEDGGAQRLNESLDELVEHGTTAVEGAVRIAGNRSSVDGKYVQLADLRAVSGVSAIAIYDSARAPLLWAGEHRGQVPTTVFEPERGYVYQHGPLFRYLYVTRPVPGGGVAFAAMLLESDLASVGEMRPFAMRFERETGLSPRFSTPEQASCGNVWDWSLDEPILSVCFDALTQTTWWLRVTDRARWTMGAIWLASLGLLAFGWFRRRMPAPGLPIAVTAAILAVVPIGRLASGDALFSPVQFVLPVPWDITLGTLLVLLFGAAVWILVRTGDRDPSRFEMPWWGQASIGAGAIVLAIEIVRRSSAVGLLAGHGAGGIALQLAAILTATIPIYLALWLGPRRPFPRQRAGVLILGGFALAVSFGIGFVLWWDPTVDLPVWVMAIGAIPLVAIFIGYQGIRQANHSFRAWLLAGAFSVALTLPALWTLHVQAKLQTAEIELGRLGVESDPFLDFLLRTFAERARHFEDEGEEGVNLLYRSWVASGLAAAGYEARLTLWEGGEPGSELRLGGPSEVPMQVAMAVADARGEDREVVANYTDSEDLQYLLLVPLPGDRIVSVALPPRSRLGAATALARFLEQSDAPASSDFVESPYLVPISNAEAADTARGVRWLRTETGWQSEASTRFPSGWMHVHLLVRTAASAILLVRGVLVGTALLGALVFLWVVARGICGEIPARELLSGTWLRSFRGRLTLALFVFFLLPTAIFGVAAYQAVSREVIRSAADVALRALAQTVENFSRRGLAELSAEAGVDLLLYRDGVLADAGAPEVLELGLFDTWLPPDIHQTFVGGEDLEDWEIRALGDNEYVVGYRRFSADAVFAAPIPLALQEITRRQTEFRDIALFVALIGGALSVVLALLVGRAFTRPIDELSRATAAIGSGNLRVQLPAARRDEFGPVYQSFNRMVHRLRRARSELVQEKRRTETIVEEAATGVIAFDSEGRVELVNPRAEEILGIGLPRGAKIERSTEMLEEVAEAVDDFLASEEEEGALELDLAGRILRLRLRRLKPSAGRSGAVVAVEDLTSEIRSARVLAWGEMARQVAHEIKNPLTPIKLSVQHLRRAFLDGRKDFSQILDRNVESILVEIDRLSEIARAFSRFGAPPAAAAELESVEVARAVHDTLALYLGAGDGVRYVADVAAADGVCVVARLGELKEVLVNLLENAREAVQGGGEVRLAVEPTSNHAWIDLVVADTGEGIDPQSLPHIFEPQFSTRTSGTGLGLAIVRRMVESWGGDATATSQLGVGTVVRLRLRTAPCERAN